MAIAWAQDFGLVKVVNCITNWPESDVEEEREKTSDKKKEEKGEKKEVEKGKSSAKTEEKRDFGKSTWSVSWSPANDPGRTHRRATWPVLTLWPAKRIKPLNCWRRVTRHVKGRL